MSERNGSLIVVCLDGVGAGWLGPYGNTWYETPFWNRIASDGLLFEFAYSSGPQLAQTYRDYWSGDLAQLAHGRRTAFLSDDPRVASLSEAEPFDERVLLEAHKPSASANEVEQTHAAQTLAAAANWIADADSPFLLWLHVSALTAAWDAPYALRCLAADDDDPDPPDFIDPPSVELARDFDPDELLGYLQAHAGQSSALDAALDAFVRAVDALPAAQDCALVFTSPRGYALGEHGRIGGDESLYGELLQVPCIVRFPNQRWASQRSSRILQPAGVLEIADAWIRGEPDEQFVDRLGIGFNLSDRRRIAICRCQDRYAIRSPSWFLSQSPDGCPELYAKPDDRWEVNEVSDRCPDVVEQLTALIEQYQQSRQSGAPFDPELSALLLDGFQ